MIFYNLIKIKSILIFKQKCFEIFKNTKFIVNYNVQIRAEHKKLILI